MRLSLRDTRYKMPAGKRKIGGKVYEYLHLEDSKRDAEETADRWREKGYLVRITPYGRKYAIYTRRR